VTLEPVHDEVVAQHERKGVDAADFDRRCSTKVLLTRYVPNA
jgi:hypothetical protein